MNFSKALICLLLFAGCAGPRRSTPQAQPFAALYGSKQAQWLSDNKKAVFESGRGTGSFHEVEIQGFRKIDTDNQKRYLVVRFCSHQLDNAEGGSQIWRLIADLKCSKKEVLSYIASLDRKDLRRYAGSLDGSIETFDRNVRHYLQ